MSPHTHTLFQYACISFSPPFPTLSFLNIGQNYQTIGICEALIHGKSRKCSLHTFFFLHESSLRVIYSDRQTTSHKPPHHLVLLSIYILSSLAFLMVPDCMRLSQRSYYFNPEAPTLWSPHICAVMECCWYIKIASLCLYDQKT